MENMFYSVEMRIKEEIGKDIKENILVEWSFRRLEILNIGKLSRDPIMKRYPTLNLILSN